MIGVAGPGSRPQAGIRVFWLAHPILTWTLWGSNRALSVSRPRQLPYVNPRYWYLKTRYIEVIIAIKEQH